MPLVRFRFRNGTDEPAHTSVHLNPSKGGAEEWIHVPGPTDQNPGPPAGVVPPHTEQATMPGTSYMTSDLNATEVWFPISGRQMTLGGVQLVAQDAPLEEFLEGAIDVGYDPGHNLAGTLTLYSSFGRVYMLPLV